MDVLKIADAKERALVAARANGHTMRRWVRGRAEYYRCSCKKCGSQLVVRSTVLEDGAAERAEKAGVIIGHCEFGQRGWDFTLVEGMALAPCRMR